MLRANLSVLAPFLVASLALPAAAAPPTAERAPARKKGTIARVQEILRPEPTIKEVQKSALAHYQLEPERISGLMTAARLKGLVPEIDAGFDSTVGHNYTNTQDALYPTFPYKDKQAASNDELVWHVRAVWDFSRLVFNPEQLDVTTLSSLQETLVREVTSVYFARRRAIAALVLSPPADDEEEYFEELRVEEMTATLDAFTGGQFASRAWHGDALR